MAEQFENADTEDGDKILGHILGDKNEETIQKLAEQTESEPDGDLFA